MVSGGVHRDSELVEARKLVDGAKKLETAPSGPERGLSESLVGFGHCDSNGEPGN
jgi:hypothetical protein